MTAYSTPQALQIVLRICYIVSNLIRAQKNPNDDFNLFNASCKRTGEKTPAGLEDRAEKKHLPEIPTGV